MRIMMIKKNVTLILFVTLSLLFAAATTAAANALLDFSESLKTFRANFTQTVYDADSVVLQESKGIVSLARPGRFKWTYDDPINQIIVADGSTLWVYDVEIKQVTRQPQSTTLGSAPIGLLSGQRDIESEFVVTELGKKDDLDWFQLEPLVSDTDFNQIFIALQDDGLSAMELRDNFDQATQIVFSNFEKNITIDSEQFLFTVPDGVDVVGEEGVPQSQREELPADKLSEDDLLLETPPAQTAPAEPEQPVQAESTQGSNDTVTGSSDARTDDPSIDSSTVNSDDDLLGDQPSGDTTQPQTEVVPQNPSASDPSREITFEERRISN